RWFRLPLITGPSAARGAGPAVLSFVSAGASLAGAAAGPRAAFKSARWNPLCALAAAGPLPFAAGRPLLFRAAPAGAGAVPLVAAGAAGTRGAAMAPISVIGSIFKSHEPEGVEGPIVRTCFCFAKPDIAISIV